jgi:gamma-glutamylcyclotransferase (GGCT)/AIG2-like uncharacterized protein YtfP
LAEPRLLDRVFAYGTLRPRHAPSALAPLLGRASSLGAASVPGLLYDLGAYPAATPPTDARPESRVYGEVLRFAGPASWMDALDAYEGFNPGSRETSLFVRDPCTATLCSGQRVRCWIYLYRGTPPAHAQIASGRWEGPSLLR